jgi:ribonuclease HI
MDVEIYTDGSVYPNPGNGGWACILKAGDYIKELSGGEKDTTNNRMEIEAVIQALKALKEGAKKHRIIIYSDSQWVINACQGNWNIKKNLDKVKEAKDLIAKSGCKIEWRWLKGHAGHEYNERCDKLALAEVRKLGTHSEKVVPIMTAEETKDEQQSHG